MLYDTYRNKICNYRYMHFENEQLNYDTYCCPRCYKIADGDDVDLQKKAKRCRCKPRFGDGITKITKESYKPNYYKRVIDNMGRISKKLQELDYAVTSVKELKDNDLLIYVYAEDERPLGYIAIKPYRDTYLATDFMVVEYKQRQGIGSEMFEHMLKDINASPDSLVYDSPTYSSRMLLHKHYGMKKLIIKGNPAYIQ